VQAEPTQLQQVILNLVKNAADAMKGVPRGERRLRLVTGFDRKSRLLPSELNSKTARMGKGKAAGFHSWADGFAVWVVSCPSPLPAALDC
jgi:signal transduction histidine kinase